MITVVVDWLTCEPAFVMHFPDALINNVRPLFDDHYLVWGEVRDTPAPSASEPSKPQ